MWELIFVPQTQIFGIAIMVMLLLGILELISLLLGGSNDWLDNLLPDSLADHIHPDVALDTADAGLFIRFLSWLYIGKLPLLMLMVLFFALFGIVGYSLQALIYALFGGYLNMWLAALLSWGLCLPLVRWSAGGLYRIMPKDETTAIDVDSLIGAVATVVLGTATSGSPAQARVKDKYQQQHYILVEPDDDGELTQGDSILLVSRQHTVFKAIKNPNHNLINS
ncbi:DUF1449 family protein [Muribacter muris]|uniref:DUF1449 family protein n=1 Tax=Muribacter muris TaxID=67855 RepID=A0A4Y9K1V1_9PAST|nr:YqiJ family protein [Muribacter muris]MBF0784692.1 YqiJ family protein [Muribacter muris]MBF0827861.1 YqiJ family protein [Muribacter muris]TFV11119.1 DUF1449 family protein [Muribacter muris]